jgi:hypothetical protein
MYRQNDVMKGALRHTGGGTKTHGGVTWLEQRMIYRPRVFLVGNPHSRQQLKETATLWPSSETSCSSLSEAQ